MIRATSVINDPASFRDSHGFVFRVKDKVYRKILPSSRPSYEHMMVSGLYNRLMDSELLIPHREVRLSHRGLTDAYKILEPEKVEFISYPYEWCFSQLKDAALATLRIQREAMTFGMSLIDSSAYNIQFRQGKPILIDTLSFEKYREGTPWVAYGQFCRHFLAPLALMSKVNVRLVQLLRNYIDGIPLDLAQTILPARSLVNIGLDVHIFLHNLAYRHASLGTWRLAERGNFSLSAFQGLLDSLENTLHSLKWNPDSNGWANYYSKESSVEYFQEKSNAVKAFSSRVRPRVIWDFGSNTGLMSRYLITPETFLLSFDSDVACVEINYQECKRTRTKNVLPLFQDITNPSPSIGWNNKERLSFQERRGADLLLVLGLIHHLAISNNIRFSQMADFLQPLGRFLVVEFVPKADPLVQKLLIVRKDIFEWYTLQDFKLEFSKRFSIIDSVRLRNSGRTLFLMKSIRKRREGSVHT